ncbi:MAG: hypothetical protein K8H86_05745 [Ignavibacteriaceae bacterium]|nr:hypothetical protein [Ignavibacteriaceae bacterium]
MICKKFILLLFILCSTILFAQEEITIDSLSVFLNATGISAEALNNMLGEIYSSTLKQSATINEKVKETFLREKPWAILDGLTVSVKTFQTDNPQNAAALGIDYEYNKNLIRYFFDEDGTTSTGMNISINASGNAAFVKTLNPNNFLNSKASVHFFRSWGGALMVDDQTATDLNILEDSLVFVDDVDNNPLWQEFLSKIVSHLSTQTFVDVSITGGLESNQDFSQKKYTFGGKLGFDLKAWNDNSTLAKWNVFDYPFASIRFLTGLDKDFIPYGSSYPTLLIGYSLVNPAGNVIKNNLDETKSYGRFDAEAGFKTIVTLMNEKPVFFEASLSYYAEFNASEKIKKAGINEFIFFSAALRLPTGAYFSYSTGKLPLDFNRDQVYSLGFELQF